MKNIIQLLAESKRRLEEMNVPPPYTVKVTRDQYQWLKDNYSTPIPAPGMSDSIMCMKIEIDE